MASALAFMPWVTVGSAKKIEGIRLIPYERGVLPGSQSTILQSDMDAILSAYTDFQGTPIQKATLLEVGDWRSGADVSGHLRKLFKAQRMLAFAALSDRTLFGGHFGYCNAHNYELIVQSFTPGNVRSIALETRRRDEKSGTLWSSSVPAFRRPLHVPTAEVSFDGPLLQSLWRLQGKDKTFNEAIVDFNGANTDSPDVPVSAEVVMMKAAFEWLYRIDHQAESLVKAVLRGLPPSSRAGGSFVAKWSLRYKKRKDSVAHWRPIIGWVREFCLLRNASAHGRRRSVYKPVWRPDAHLAFASILFPLLMKQELARLGRYFLSDKDAAMLGAIDQFLACDPMRRRTSDQHPWHDVELTATLDLSLRQLAKVIAEPSVA